VIAAKWWYSVNHKSWSRAVLLILIPFVALAARRQVPQTHGQMAMKDPNWEELMRSMDRMHAAMTSIQPSGVDDTDFVQVMLPHHQAAIDMAKSELIYGNDPQIRRLAQEIIIDQQSEIQLMQLWTKQHDSDSQKRN
jgi:uncharacterized protein (DUF305 family)